MPKANPIREKSYAFSIKIVHLCTKMQEAKEYVISKQLLKSGTSIGANVREATQGQSKPDFVSKLSISLKEAHETDYWLSIIKDTMPVFADEAITLLHELNEIISLLTAIIKTTKASLQ